MWVRYEDNVEVLAFFEDGVCMIIRSLGVVVRDLELSLARAFESTWGCREGGWVDIPTW